MISESALALRRSIQRPTARGETGARRRGARVHTRPEARAVMHAGVDTRAAR